MNIIVLVYSFLIFIAIFQSMPKNTIINNKIFNVIFIIILSLLSIYVVFITDPLYTDRSVYTRMFNLYDSYDLKTIFENINHEPLFLLSTNLISKLLSDEIFYYVILHIIFLVFLILGLIKIKNTYMTVISLFIFINFIFYYAYTLNGIRQGLAFACIVYLLGLLIENKKVKAIAFSIVPILFHYTSLPVVLTIFVVKYFNNRITLKILFIIYFFTSFLYLLDLQPLLLGFLNFDYLLEYTNIDLLQEFGETNDINFLLFNTFFLFVFYAIYKNNKDETLFLFLYKIYIILSIYFILFGFVAFSNRIAAYSWLFIPIILAITLERSKHRYFVLSLLIIIIFIGIASGIPEFFLGV